jgi:CRISPR-associated protein Cas2
MSDEHLYLVTYDIADERRWRGVFKLMHAYGEWLQLSVFQCRLTRARQLEMVQRLSDAIANDEDHVMVVDLGAADNVQPRIRSLGKRAVSPIERRPIIV